MTGSNVIEVVTQDLALVAERQGDITQLLFQRFFQKSSASLELMKHSDVHMQGRMLEGVLELLFEDRHLEAGGYLEWELENHVDAYGATFEMYDAFFAALLEVIRECLGDDWSDERASAWQARVDAILEVVSAYEARSMGQSSSI